MAKHPRSSDPRPNCEGCFFGRRNLCALELAGPCATFRADSPEGLKPPRQLRFAFRVTDTPRPAPVAPLRPAFASASQVEALREPALCG